MKSARTTPITPDDYPDGCTVYQLVPVVSGQRITAIGRKAGGGRPCPNITSPCGQHTADIYRCPTTGLNLPGESSPVLELIWCWRCGDVDQQVVSATEQEQHWGWTVTSQV